MGRLDFLEMRLPGNIMTSKNILAALVVVICSLVLYLRQLLLPVDKRNPPKGKRWKLPPGPQGFPILGNLFLFAKGEQAVGTTLNLKSLELTLNRPMNSPSSEKWPLRILGLNFGSS